MKDTRSGTPYTYAYERRFAEAACIQSNDSQGVKKQKMQDFWNRHEASLVCNSVQFDVLDGSIIKYAVQSKFEDFIDDVISWDINLNRVDATDNRTPLDYVQFHLQKNAGSDLEIKFKYFYQKLRKAGALHLNEIAK